MPKSKVPVDHKENDGARHAPASPAIACRSPSKPSELRADGRRIKNATLAHVFPCACAFPLRSMIGPKKHPERLIKFSLLCANKCTGLPPSHPNGHPVQVESQPPPGVFFLANTIKAPRRSPTAT
jgi:hypothetical protein